MIKDKLDIALRDLNQSTHRVLCILNGQLVIAEVTVNKGATGISCPQCFDPRFTDDGVWVQCDCGFSYDSSSLKKIHESIK